MTSSVLLSRAILSSYGIVREAAPAKSPQGGHAQAFAEAGHEELAFHTNQDFYQGLPEALFTLPHHGYAAVIGLMQSRHQCKCQSKGSAAAHALCWLHLILSCPELPAERPCQQAVLQGQSMKRPMEHLMHIKKLSQGSRSGYLCLFCDPVHSQL